MRAQSAVVQWVGLPLTAFLCPVIICAIQRGVIYDDPYIELRYGEHLAEGMGWSFNPGLPTNNAVTSPLYVLLIAAGKFLGASVDVWSTCIYCAAWGLGGIVLARILFFDGRLTGGWLACGLYSIAPLLGNVRGMETSLYLLLILSAIWAFQYERWLVVGCLLGLLALARLDGVLLAGVLIAWLAVRRSRSALTVLGPFVAITATWAAVSWAITGSPIPSTLAAKIAQRDSGWWGSQFSFLEGLTTNGVVGLEGHRDMGTGITSILLPILAGIALLILPVFGTVVAFRRSESALPMLAIVAAIVVLEYGVGLRMPSSYTWHYGPWTLWVVAGGAIGLEEAARRGHRVVGTVGTALAVALSLATIQLGPPPDRSHYREVAEWIDRDTASPHPTVAAVEIGAIGYYSHADMVDYLGLLDSRANATVRHGNFTWWMSTKPDYWVTTGKFIDAATLGLPEFQREYTSAAIIGPFTIYRRSLSSSSSTSPG